MNREKYGRLLRRAIEETYKQGVEVNVQDRGPISTGGAGRKDDGGKARFDLIPAEPLEKLAQVYEMGARKYADRNWEKGIQWGRVFAAIMRHLWAFWRGESIDKESGLPHTIHAAWGCLALTEFARTHPELDDRPATTFVEVFKPREQGKSEFPWGPITGSPETTPSLTGPTVNGLPYGTGIMPCTIASAGGAQNTQWMDTKDLGIPGMLWVGPDQDLQAPEKRQALRQPSQNP